MSNSNPTNNQDTGNVRNKTYATMLDGVTSTPQAKNNITVINKHTVIVNQSISANIIQPLNANNNQTAILNKQEVGLAKERLPDNVFSRDNNFSNDVSNFA